VSRTYTSNVYPLAILLLCALNSSPRGGNYEDSLWCNESSLGCAIWPAVRAGGLEMRMKGSRAVR